MLLLRSAAPDTSALTTSAPGGGSRHPSGGRPAAPAPSFLAAWPDDTVVAGP
ncbi:hypothetical protein [Isoptericola dokdonensis]|uniref:hypothetical protein n=1 Tax=Isoptericola dokdonensis TaxID=372663 RepID=UPI0012F9B94D|nr:hypothetical protein [Isoptericola dokdonensis]